MGINYDIFSASAAGNASKAANAADTNLNASLALLQMVNNMDKAIHKMRDWQTGRFNEIIVAMRNMKEQNLKMEDKINDLQGQVAALQKRLYDEEQNKTPLKAVAR